MRDTLLSILCWRSFHRSFVLGGWHIIPACGLRPIGGWWWDATASQAGASLSEGERFDVAS